MKFNIITCVILLLVFVEGKVQETKLTNELADLSNSSDSGLDTKEDYGEAQVVSELLILDSNEQGDDNAYKERKMEIKVEMDETNAEKNSKKSPKLEEQQPSSQRNMQKTLIKNDISIPHMVSGDVTSTPINSVEADNGKTASEDARTLEKPTHVQQKHFHHIQSHTVAIKEGHDNDKISHQIINRTALLSAIKARKTQLETKDALSDEDPSHISNIREQTQNSVTTTKVLVQNSSGDVEKETSKDHFEAPLRKPKEKNLEKISPNKENKRLGKVHHRETVASEKTRDSTKERVSHPLPRKQLKESKVASSETARLDITKKKDQVLSRKKVSPDSATATEKKNGINKEIGKSPSVPKLNTESEVAASKTPHVENSGQKKDVLVEGKADGHSIKAVDIKDTAETTPQKNVFNHSEPKQIKKSEVATSKQLKVESRQIKVAGVLPEKKATSDDTDIPGKENSINQEVKEPVLRVPNVVPEKEYSVDKEIKKPVLRDLHVVPEKEDSVDKEIKKPVLRATHVAPEKEDSADQEIKKPMLRAPHVVPKKEDSADQEMKKPVLRGPHVIPEKEDGANKEIKKPVLRAPHVVPKKEDSADQEMKKPVLRAPHVVPEKEDSVDKEIKKPVLHAPHVVPKKEDNVNKEVKKPVSRGSLPKQFTKTFQAEAGLQKKGESSNTEDVERKNPGMMNSPEEKKSTDFKPIITNAKMTLSEQLKRNHSTLVVTVSLTLIISTILLTVVGVYFRKISLERRRYEGHHLLQSTDEDELPLFNRETYHDHDDTRDYTSWDSFRR